MSFKNFSRKLRAPFNRRSANLRLAKFHSEPYSLSNIVIRGMDLGTSGLYRVTSVQNKSEILSLLESVKAIEPLNILEIGTCNGGTLFMWANLAKNKAVSCDLYKNEYRIQLYNQFPPPASECKVSPLTGDSHDAEFIKSVYEHFGGQKVDFLFIDGDHTAKGVEADFYNFKNLVAKGGIIAFHDIVEDQPTEQNQVYNFWEKIKQEYKYEEFIDSPGQCGCGIGILHV